MARAPPAAATLTGAEVASVLEEAVRLWGATDLASTGANRLAGIEVRIGDLPAGEVGHADGLTITLDPTAAGRSWFVDTPAEHSEFGQLLENSRIAADADSQAYGRIDLLTVLVHEVGPVLGFDHQAGPAVMGAVLAAGQRVLLPGSSAGRVAGDPVSAASTVPPNLD